MYFQVSSVYIQDAADVKFYIQLLLQVNTAYFMSLN